MKILTTAALFLALCSSALAHNLDKHDAGEYVLLNTQQQATPTMMRFSQKGKQWVMDGKQGRTDWQPVCRGDGECKLKPSSAAQVRQWQKLLPSSFQTAPMSCIQNIAFAFCRVSKPDNPDMRLYWWFAWQDGQTYALGLNRLR